MSRVIEFLYGLVWGAVASLVMCSGILLGVWWGWGL